MKKTVYLKKLSLCRETLRALSLTPSPGAGVDDTSNGSSGKPKCPCCMCA